MSIKVAKISIKGNIITVPAIFVDNFTVIVIGKLLKVAMIKDETWQNYKIKTGHLNIINELKNQKIKADIFTFTQKLTEREKKYDYYMEWDNVAAIPISTFENWWTKQINAKTRNMVRKAKKKGVEVRVSEFDSKFIDGVAGIYNETPVRQGRPFWHYGKDVERIRNENSHFLERSDFIGAYYGNELIGFIKLVYVGKVAGMMQIISKVKERDKAPNNVLIAKAVETCADKKIEFLTYSKFNYGQKGMDPIAKFKKHNGFQKIDLQQYYVPLSIKGNIGLKLGLHHELNELIPQGLVSYYRKIRETWYKKIIRTYPQKTRHKVLIM